MSQSQRRATNKSKPSTSSQRAGPSSQFVVDDEETLPASQISPEKNLTDQEHNHHVANVVKYILAADHTKVAIAKTSISKAVNCHNRNFKKILEKAFVVLRETFGYKVEEVDGKLIVINTIKNNLPHLEYEEDVSTRYVLLFIILAHIYMSGNSCSQSSIENFLTTLDIINSGNMKSDVFGDVSELISEFVKEKYLLIDKKENTEAGEPEFRWGARAELELLPRTVMEFVSKVYHGKSIESWPQQYKKMLEIENEARHNVRRM